MAVGRQNAEEFDQKTNSPLKGGRLGSIYWLSMQIVQERKSETLLERGSMLFG